MVDQVIRARFDFSNTPGAMPNRAIPQGGAAIQQADGKLLTIKPNGTLRVTDIRDIVEQLATGPLAAAFALKADLVDGVVPLAQLPPGFGGGPVSVTASQITDATSFGRGILTGTRDAARTALGLGTAAVLAVGVSGGVMAYDDPRIGTGGGGGAPSTVTASQISDASSSGRTVLTGTVPQALTALGLSTATTTATLSGLSSSLAHVAVRADPAPAWATFKGDNNSLLVNLNEAPGYIWPGGGDYACVSAITGAVRLPPEAKNNLINGGPAIIIAAGISGLAISDGDTNVSVGVYGSGGINIEQGRSWGSNFTLANFAKRGVTPSQGFNGQLIISELDLNLKRPPGGWAGTNAYGTSTVLSLDYAPDGGLIAHHISAVDIGTHVGWKVGISTDQGSCLEFAQIHTSKYPGQGASGSQSLHFISTLGNAPDQYRHGFLALAPDGGFVMQPDYYVGTGQFTVANSNLSQACTMHPSNGFSGPSLYVSGSITAGGNGGISGNLAVGALMQTTLLKVDSTATFNGDITQPSGLLSTSRIRFGGKDVQLAPGNAIPNGFNVLIVQA